MANCYIKYKEKCEKSFSIPAILNGVIPKPDPFYPVHSEVFYNRAI